MPKKHHYVPVTYLRRFVGADGMLLVYRKDEPAKPFRQRPESTGFETHYYSQIDDNGVRDDSRLEALFSEIESPWPAIVDAFAKRERSFPAATSLIPFLTLMRVRGPAFRDAAELHLSNLVHLEARMLNESGSLPPPPEGHEDLLEKIQIAIDPQQSLIAMAESLKVIGEFLASLSYDVLHNDSDVMFFTSDNPVIYFDPNVPDRQMRPYTVRPTHGPTELLFPVSPRMVLRGRNRPIRSDIAHKQVGESRIVTRINRLIARFAYRTIFANCDESATIIEQNAALSPVPRFEHIPTHGGGYFAHGQFVFGVRPSKPKW